MKKVPVLFLALLCTLAACIGKAPKKFCHTDVIVTNPYIGFVGFRSEDLDTIRLRTYVLNGRYDSLLSDTTYHFAATIISDTARHADSSIAYIAKVNRGRAYEVEFPATGHTYRIDGFYYLGPAGYDAYTDECRKMGYTIRGTDSTNVDGMPTPLQVLELNLYTGVYLRK